MTLLNLSLCLLPVSRHSLLLRLLGTSFERAIKFHRYAARATLLCALVHLVDMLALFGSAFCLSANSNPNHGGPVFGLLAVVCFGVMAAVAVHVVRRKRFELFWYTHSLFDLGVILVVIHSPLSLLLLWPGCLLWIVDT